MSISFPLSLSAGHGTGYDWVVARVRVKICGVTRPEDAAAACRHGADAIGIIFQKASPRNSTLERAREIMAALAPLVTPVAVFADNPIQEILDTAATLGIRTVQLNGDQTPGDVAELSGLAVLKAIRVTRGGLQAQVAPWRGAKLPNLSGFVMEPGNSKQAGGSGIANDWGEVKSARQAGAFEGTALIAAGGLKPETVAQVVRDVQPYAVDVSTGVESSMGVKSEEKIRDFIAAARSQELPQPASNAG